MYICPKCQKALALTVCACVAMEPVVISADTLCWPSRALSVYCAVPDRDVAHIEYPDASESGAFRLTIVTASSSTSATSTISRSFHTS
jgi:hypothetical protein